MTPDEIAAAQKKSVRVMGMGVGVFIMLIGGFFLLSGAMVAVVILLSLLGLAANNDPVPPLIWGVTAMFFGLGLPIFLYGKSLFRRARTDEVIVATPTLPSGPGAADHRGLAWVAVVFSSLMIVSSVGIALSGKTGAYGGMWFVAVLVGAVRYLRRTS